MILHVLLVPHRAPVQARMRRLLPRDFVVEVARGRDELWAKAKASTFDWIVLSRPMLEDSPAELIELIRSLPDAPDLVVLSNGEDKEDAALLIAAGCATVLNLQLSNKVLSDALLAVMLRRLERQDSAQRSTNLARPGLGSFVSRSTAMQRFLRMARRVVGSDASLLITGETGVGKEWLARALHYEGPRSRGPFIAVNCGALPESLLESELFGHEEGAFTGATRSRRGMFELAHQGTIFLDEIAEMPVHLQVKLLRVLQSKEIQRVGSERTIAVDVRVIAATNRTLDEEMALGRFRPDLFYRLSVVNLEIPPLRERVEDIPALLDAAVEHFRRQFPQGVVRISPRAVQACQAYPWPGNVRELFNVVERAMLLCEGQEIGLEELPEGIRGAHRIESRELSFDEGLPAAWLDRPLRELREEMNQRLEAAYIRGLLSRHRGRIAETAKAAELDPRSLYAKMRSLGLRKEDFKKEPVREKGRGPSSEGEHDTR